MPAFAARGSVGVSPSAQACRRTRCKVLRIILRRKFAARMRSRFLGKKLLAARLRKE
jgi:hypothetical protein